MVFWYCRINWKVMQNIDNKMKRIDWCFIFLFYCINSKSRLLIAIIFSYFELFKDSEDSDKIINSNNVWLDFCLNNNFVKIKCVTFLKIYIKNSEQKFSILILLKKMRERLQKTKYRKTIISTHNLLNIWKSLIVEANATVFLKKKTKEFYEKKYLKIKIYESY